MRVLLLFLYLLVAVSGQSAPIWSLLAEDGPTERGLGLLTYNSGDNSLVLFGGASDDRKTAFNDVWKFDIGSSTWNQVNAGGDGNEFPVKRFSFNGGIDTVGNRLVIFGGETSDKTILNDIWVFNLGTNTWEELTPTTGVIPEKRYGSSGGVITTQTSSKRYLIVSHGFDRKNRWDNTFAFDLITNTWIDITPTSGEIPTGRCLVAGAIAPNPSNADEAYLGMYGGCGSGGYGPCPSSEMWILGTTNLDSGAEITTTWTKAPTCVNARNYGAMASDANNFYLYGGSGGVLVSKDEPGQLNTINFSDLQSLEWNQNVFTGSTNSVPEQPTNTQSASVVVNGILYLFLGKSNQLWTIDVSNSGTFGDLTQQECHNDPIPGWRTAHGVLMGLSWGFMLPIGVLIARFGRRRDPLWFKLHRVLNSVGVLLMLVGCVIAFLMVATGHFLALAHSLIGALAVVLGLQQPLNAFCRPHVIKGEEKSGKRKCWEIWHKNSGRVALLCGIINPFIGISYLVGVNSAGFIIYTIWIGIYVLTWIYLTGRGLPFSANGPSAFAQFVNKSICCFLEPWGDDFKPRNDVESQASLPKPVSDVHQT